MVEQGHTFLLKSRKSSTNKSTLDNLYFPAEKHAPKPVQSEDYLYDDEVNFCISDTDLHKLTKTRWNVRLEKKMTLKEFESEANKLYKCCLKSVSDLHVLHLRRIAGLNIMNDIIRRADASYIKLPHVIHMTWAIMSCIHHFQLRLRSGSSGLVQYVRKRKAASCMKTYSKFIRMFKPSMYRLILNSIIFFYKEGRLWTIEFACTDLIVELLGFYEDVEAAVNDFILNAEDASLVDETEAQQLIQVLYEVLKRIKWHTMSKALMSRFLNILESSIIPKDSDKFHYAPLKTGLHICLRNIMDNLRNKDLMKLLGMTVQKMNADDVKDELITQLGYHIASYAASKCTFKLLHKYILPSFMDALMALCFSKNLVKYTTALRIWQNLIDRHGNASKFMPPRIYFPDVEYKLTIKKCPPGNRLFFDEFRSVHVAANMAIWRFAPNRRALEDVYKYHASVITEIPCGLTASTFVTIAMSVQEYAFSLIKTDLVRSHHLHALVLSLMSLICYTHKAKVFFDYVTEVMERRAEWAPHLNPPLKEKYAYAQHHILWNKPDLFFEDWEVRYGLWKCFRTKERKR